MKITIKDDFAGNIEVDTYRRDKVVYKKGAMICFVAPWSSSGCPLTLSISICPDGSILHRGWSWTDDRACNYLHTTAKAEDVEVTSEMKETLAGLWSGRIKVDGIKIAVGATPQRICPINLKDEEKRAGKQLFVA